MSALASFVAGRRTKWVALGIILDTFIVRTIMVPAAGELIGDKIWWPSTAKGGSVLHEDTGEHRQVAPGEAGS